MIRLPHIIFISSFIVLFAISQGQELEPEITLDKKKLIILTNEDENNKISEKIYQIASSAATQLKRYDVMDRNQLNEILNLFVLIYISLYISFMVETLFPAVILTQERT